MKSKGSLLLSRLEPLTNLSIFQVKVEVDHSTIVYVPRILQESINSPHGIYLPGDLKELRPETSRLIASALEYKKPSPSIIDTGGPLNASLAAQYPKARLVTSSYFVDRRTLTVEGLTKAICTVRTYTDNAGYVGTQKATRSGTKHNVTTGWRLPIHKDSIEKIIDIKIKTTEHLTPSIYALQSKTVQSWENTNLGQLHPTFSIHQKVTEHTLPFFKDEQDTAPLRLARLLFGLADEQSPCKRMDRVGIEIKTSTKRTATPSENSIQVFGYATIDRVRYEQTQNSKLTEMLPNESHRVYVALGSNVGGRIGNIEAACQRMHDRGIKVTRTSALYETKAMYLEDQESFINGACEVSCAHTETDSCWTKTPASQVITSLGPPELLDQLKAIEKELGREKTIDNGPRTIDLDILLYENKVLESERLSIPHQRMLEREFVLRPLCE